MPLTIVEPGVGGTGTTTATGTGSAVLSNSPTLVTPTLGSATATQLTTGLGTAGAPALTFTGDTNTGIFSPAADTIAFAEGGTEAMRLDSSGNVLIGTTANSTGAKINVSTDGSAINRVLSFTNTQSSGRTYQFLNGGGTAGKFEIYDATADAGRIAIDASGNIGIGTASSVNGLSIYRYGTQWTGNTGNTYPVPAGNVFLQTQTVGGADNWFGTTGTYGATTGSSNLLLQANLNNTSQQAGNYIGSEATGSGLAALTFGRMIGGATTGANATKSEAMRIDSAGRLNINCTSNPLPANGAARINMIVPSGDDGINIRHNHDGNCINIWRTAGNGAAISFYQSAAPTQTAVGLISTTGSSTSYNTSSDYRLKENIAPMTGALDTVSQLKPVTYTWKADGSDGQGFIAHELQEVVPECVSGEKDAVNEDGSIKPQGIDTSFLVATLTAAIQEQQQIINDLKARIETLEAK